MTFLSTDGFIIGYYHLGKGDYLLKFFTEKIGLAKVIAGHQKIEANPSILCLTHLDKASLIINISPDRTWSRLIDLEIKERNIWLAEELSSLGYAMLILEVVESLSAEEDPQVELYHLLEDYLRESRKRSNHENTALYVLLHIFKLLGYGIFFDNCRKCYRSPGEGNFFQPSVGGFIHDRCRNKSPGGLKVSRGSLLFLNKMSSSTWDKAKRLKGDRQVQKEVFDVASVYINYLCQKKLSSQSFLSRLPPAAAKKGTARK